jgi:hypothetical protein
VQAGRRPRRELRARRYPMAANHADRLILQQHTGKAGLREKPDRSSTNEHEDSNFGAAQDAFSCRSRHCQRLLL